MGEVIEFPLYAEPDEHPDECEHCGGRMVIEIRAPAVYGPIIEVIPCRHCKGTGRG